MPGQILAAGFLLPCRRLFSKEHTAPDDSALNTHTLAIAEVHILWLTQGLGCDGDTCKI